MTSLAYWDWQRFREVNLMRAYRTACDRVVAFGGHGCFLHFGEFFSSVDAINAVIFFQLANVSSITDLIVDTNFINFQKTQVDPVAASVLVSSAQLYEERSGNNAAKKRIWFEGAVERLGSGGGNLGGNVQILRDGFRHAVEAGATGLGVTNLKNLSYLTEIFPSPPKELVVQPWRPRALLFFPSRADGSPDERTLHAGEPAAAGEEKWVAQLWLHESAYKPTVPRESSHEAAEALVLAAATREGLRTPYAASHQPA